MQGQDDPNEIIPMNCTVYIDPASLDFPPDVFPILPIQRRNRTLEKRFDFGIYDAGINDLAKFGEYQDFSMWPPKPSLQDNWSWTAPDYPYDVLKNFKGNKRAPQQCLVDTDANMQKYQHYDSVLLTVQYLFGNPESLRERLLGFLKEFGVAVFGVGNTCKLRDKKKQYAIGRVLVKICEQYECQPHIFGCPSPLLDYLLAHAKFPFSIDSNKFFRRHNRMCSGKVERSLFLREYLAERGLLMTEETLQKKKWKQMTLF
jgi:hypothetical protein